MTIAEEAQAQLLGRVDALEIARKVSELSKSVSRYNPFDNLLIRKDIKNIMTTTMSILSPEHSSLFSEREVREAYYRSFERYMQEVRLVREGFQYAPEGTEFVRSAQTQAQTVSQ